MKNYVIINGVNSLTITGLAISKLPSISKPPLRVMTEEINGRDGDLITDLGYGAYDKELVIGLYGNYDINEVIGFFNQEGTIVFSNEDDKYYNFKIINQIDYEALIKFRTATINLHCQPFKYPLTETPEEITTEYVEDEGETITLNDTKIAPLTIDLKGNTSQNGTPTPSSPVNVNVVSGDNEVVVCGKNLFNLNNVSGTNNGVTYSVNSNGELVLNGTLTSDRVEIPLGTQIKLNGTYTYSKTVFIGSIALKNSNYGNVFILGGGAGSITSNVNDTITQIVVYASNGSVYNNYAVQLQIEKGSTATSYEPYTSQNYPLYLGVENLLNPLYNLYGYGLNASGVIYENSVWSTNNSFIKVQPNTTYSFSTDIDDIQRHICFYDSTQTFIERQAIQFINTFTTGATTYYVKCAYRNDRNPTQIQLEVGSKANSYTPYGTIPIELCKIGNYQDYIYKTDKWYLHKEIGKVVLKGSETWEDRPNFSACDRFVLNYTLRNTNFNGFSNYFEIDNGTNLSSNYPRLRFNNTQIVVNFSAKGTTTIAQFKEWLSTHNTIGYYVLATPTDTEITNTTLINQLETLKGATSYEGQTNISQVNNDLPFILKVKGTKEGSGEGIINNIGNIYAKPIIELEGTGTIGIYKNGTQYFEVDMSSDNEITIDTENMEAYHNGVLKNRKVIGDYNKFTIDEGNNNIEITGELTKATISNYTRWL